MHFSASFHKTNMLHMHHQFLSNNTYVVIAVSMGNKVYNKYPCHRTLWYCNPNY